MLTSPEELKASLERHNAEFEALLKLIPAKYYLVPDDAGEQQNSKYQKNSKKQKAPKQAIKEATKKAKRDRLDPDNNKTIVQLQEEAALKKGKGRPVVSDEDEGDSEGDEIDVDMDGMGEDEVSDADGDRDSDDDNNESKKQKSKKKSKGKMAEESNGNDTVELNNFKPMAPVGSIEALRAKLHARMEELRAKKGPKSNRQFSVQTGSSPASSKDDLLEERRLQRAAMRERRRKETKEKKRREEEERAKKGKGKERERQSATSGPQTKNQLLVPDISSQSQSTSSPNSKYTNVAFSTLSGTTPTLHKSLQTSSNPSQALTQVTKRAEHRAALSPEKRAEVEAKEIWAKANARAQGAKVHDDPTRLAKAVKRREKEKAKSQKGWNERKEQLDKALAARQKKRMDNIAMRHDRKKGGGSSKGKKDTKKRPGFEGKSFGGGAKKVKKGKAGK